MLYALYGKPDGGGGGCEAASFVPSGAEVSSQVSFLHAASCVSSGLGGEQHDLSSVI